MENGKLVTVHCLEGESYSCKGEQGSDRFTKRVLDARITVPVGGKKLVPAPETHVGEEVLLSCQLLGPLAIWRQL